MCLFRNEAKAARVSTALRWLAVLTVTALLAWLAWPWLKNVMYLGELLAEDPPRTLPVPVKGVAVRAVRDTFGAPRPGDRAHQGVDIFAPRGTPVVSTTRGVVARIGENSTGGTVGTTGNARSTPPHLHYGIYRRGNGAINPFPLLMDKPAVRAEERLPRKDASAADRSAE